MALTGEQAAEEMEEEEEAEEDQESGMSILDELADCLLYTSPSPRDS